MASQRSGVINLLLTGVVMPRLNRFELGELIASAHPETSVLFRLPARGARLTRRNEGSIPAVFDRGATLSDGMPRPGSVKTFAGHTTSGG